MNRRRFLKTASGLAGTAGISGCLQQFGFETQSAWRDPPLVEDRPNGVYYPAIIEGMGVYETTTIDGIGVALMHSFPHRFWTVTGTNKTKVVVSSNDSLHLMASVWDTESGTVLPNAVSVDVRNEEGRVSTTNLWSMLSPNMGFHYGDNVALPKPGEYEATVEVAPVQTARTKPFQGRFTKTRTAQFQFTFEPSKTYDLPIRRLGEKAGSQGTVDLMEMDSVPTPVAPPKEQLPGRLLGEASAGDALFYATIVTDEQRFSTDSPHLVVSPRTPYNHVLLPGMSLSVAIERDGETVLKTGLEGTLDPDLGYYYGTPTDRIEDGDTITVEIETPPQMSRHDGYETAFMAMSPIRFSV
ncbi:iron transporter [Halobacterium hubeiense]|uniref:iron transporter n=1 Tax=Halobacterium hubeiense TaxID=1407499 RepID=UPI000B7ED372|nr:iron transporter [Halobacterium hubeiense]